MYANCSRECKGGCHGPDASDCLQCANYNSNGVSCSYDSWRTKVSDSYSCEILVNHPSNVG